MTNLNDCLFPTEHAVSKLDLRKEDTVIHNFISPPQASKAIYLYLKISIKVQAGFVNFVGAYFSQKYLYLRET